MQLNQARGEGRTPNAERQTELTSSAIAVEIAANRGQAQFAEAEQLAKKQVALAQGEARSKELIGKGESSRIAQVGLAEAAVTMRLPRSASVCFECICGTILAQCATTRSKSIVY